MTRRSKVARGALAIAAFPDWAWAQTGAIPFRQGADDAIPSGGGWLLACLVAALAASLFFAWGRRRSGLRFGRNTAIASWLARTAPGESVIDVCGSARLDMRTNLFSVTWRGQALLLASGESGVVVVASQPAAPESEARRSMS